MLLHCRAAFPLLLAAVATACHSGPPPAPPASPYGGTLITAADIAASHETNVWDVLRAKGVALRLKETYDGTPVAVESSRGKSSIELNTDPLIYVDGLQLLDLRFLKQMPAADVASIRQLTGIQATALYGTNAGSGVILITSKS